MTTVRATPARTSTPSRGADHLNAAMQRIGEAVYGQAGAGDSPDGQAGPQEETPEGTVEGEFREV